MPKRILVVERDEALSRILCDNLLFEGFEVRAASDGAGAAASTHEFLPDLVLLDTTLADPRDPWLHALLDGPRATPVIVLGVESRREAGPLPREADPPARDIGEFVRKPFDLEHLLGRARALLGVAGS
jgi:two-component system OmpR family response regulator